MKSRMLLSSIIGIIACYSVIGYGGFWEFDLSRANTLSTTQIPTTQDLRPKVWQLALRAYKNAVTQGLENSSKKIMTVIDYSLPSTQRRLWVIDLKTNRVLFHSLVAHGKGSGDIFAKRFSNHTGTLASSLGVFITENPYIGHHGYSLKINGLDDGFNQNAKARGIVIHSASYVKESNVGQQGRIGRSWGCPAVDEKIAKPLIETIKGGTMIFAYYPNQDWIEHSKFLQSS